MSTQGFIPLTRGETRVFLIEGGARGDNSPEYQDCAMGDSPERSYGDVTPIQVPSATKYGDYDDVGEIQGEKERATISLVSRMALGTKSNFLQLAERRCPFDIQIHMGKCTVPNSFNEFTKILIIENSRISNWSTDQIGSLESGDAEKVNETIDASGAVIYEVVQSNFAEVGGDAVQNPLLDVIIASAVACGDCDDEDDGCDKIYATGASSPGSPGTAPDVTYSLNEGAAWLTADINTLTPGSTGNGIAELGRYIVVVSDTSAALHWILKATLDATAPANGFSTTATGFVGVNYPNDIWSTGLFAFAVGVGGYVYGANDPTAGVTVLDAGVATTSDLECVHAVSANIAIAGGASGALVGTRNQSTWSTETIPTGLSDTITAIWMKSEREWWIGTDAGVLYYTINEGTDWTIKTLPGTAPSSITDISFATDTIMYVTGLVGAVGTLYRSYSGGNTFNIMPDSGATYPTNVGLAALAACSNDADFVVTVGDKDASDGLIVLGQS